ncbi:MAG: hypothetical protein LBP71_02960 [Spirochaetaceae bacterium]|jgi:hypothetical protein|nr:hypothetical protein [Spirochaetaceae bacterium]
MNFYAFIPIDTGFNTSVLSGNPIRFFLITRGFPKTSVFGKATLDLWEKAGFRPLFQEHFLKPTGFWEMRTIQISNKTDILVRRTCFKNQPGLETD